MVLTVLVTTRDATEGVEEHAGHNVPDDPPGAGQVAVGR